MKRLNWSIIAVAIIWAATIFAAGIVLEGSVYLAPMLRILGGGAAATIIVLGGAQRRERAR